MSERTQITPGLSWYKNPLNGFSVIELHYTADPAKRSTAWREKESLGIGASDWAREYELSWVVRVGRPVYSDFSRQFHMFGPNTVRGDVTLPTDAKLVVGHDLGPTASRMAASFNLFEKSPSRRWTIDEVFCDKASVDEYLDQVEHTLIKWKDYKDPVHVVDPTAIESVSRIEERACADLMRLRGMQPIPGERSFVKRRKFVEDSLTEFKQAAFMYQVHERCILHVEGFEGGYHYPEVSVARGGGFGAIPVKNGFSDIHDALQYAHSVAEQIFVEIKVNSNDWVNTYVTGHHGVKPRVNGMGTLPSHLSFEGSQWNR